jgi:antirestriction protein
MKQLGEIRIYAACLASYNNGVLYGRWIDACQDEDAIRDEINAMLKASPAPGAEEYAIHDVEGFEGIDIAESQGIKIVSEIAAFITEHGVLGGKLIEYYGDLSAAEETMNDHYAGVHSSLAEFAQEITEQCTEIPETLAFYIDYERMARDIEINDVLTIEIGFEEIHVFWRH